MNTYIESCRGWLERITRGEEIYEGHRGLVVEDIRKKLEEAREIIICGLSPVGKRCLRYIVDYTKAPVHVLDFRDKNYSHGNIIWGGLEEKELVKARTYIICSREEALNYFAIVPKTDSRVISYNEMLFLDKQFGLDGSLLHNHGFATGLMKNVFIHAEDYAFMLSILSDEFSKELLSRWILYRLYFDIGLMRDIKGKGRPYFDPEIIKLKEDEVFVDIGGYDGDTLSDFLAESGGLYKEYYFFEPEKGVFEKAVSKYGSDKRIIFINKGVAERTAVKNFDTGCSDVPEMIQREDGNVAVEVTALDDMEIQPTFIKMDIEGAECDALDGAEATIKKYMPRLAVCIYHRPNDILDIFHRMMAYGYSRFYVRAAENSLDYDIVLYGQS